MNRESIVRTPFDYFVWKIPARLTYLSMQRPARDGCSLWCNRARKFWQ